MVKKEVSMVVMEAQLTSSLKLNITAAELEQLLREIGAEVIKPTIQEKPAQDPYAILGGRVIAVWVKVR